MISPKFKHDCDVCRFVGRMDGHDCYVHDGGALVTALKRFSDVPEDYTSHSRPAVSVTKAKDESAYGAFDAIMRMGKP